MILYTDKAGMSHQQVLLLEQAYEIQVGGIAYFCSASGKYEQLTPGVVHCSTDAGLTTRANVFLTRIYVMVERDAPVLGEMFMFPDATGALCVTTGYSADQRTVYGKNVLTDEEVEVHSYACEWVYSQPVPEGGVPARDRKPMRLVGIDGKTAAKYVKRLEPGCICSGQHGPNKRQRSEI